MHPSAPGSGVSGASKSLQSAPNSGHGSSNAGSFIPGQGELTTPPITEGTTQAAGLWYYPSSGGSVNSKDTQHLPSSSTGPMISTPSFYNPEDPSIQQQRESERQYQQWIEDNYTGQQPSQPLTFHQETYRSTIPLAATFEQNIPIQNGYSVMQEQFLPPTTAMSQYGGSTSATITQSAIGGLEGMSDTSAYHAHSNDIYSNFYANLPPVSNSPASTPGNSTSYYTSTPESMNNSHTNTPDPVYQQQQQQLQQQHQQQQRHQHQHQHQQHQQQQQHQQRHQQSQSQQQQQQPRQASEHFSQQASHQAPIYGRNQVQQKPSNHPLHSSPYAQLPARYIPPRTQPEPAPQQSFPPATTEPRPSTLSPASKTWNNEVYQPQNPKSGTLPVHQFVPPATLSQAGPSKLKATVTAPIKKANNGEATSSDLRSQADKAGTKRKRAKKNESPDMSGFGGGDDGASDSDSDEDDDETGLGMSGRMTVGLGGLGVPNGRGKRDKGARLPGACTHCKKLKMKCDFPKHENTCKRCKSGGHVCIVEGRRPRTAPNKREYLLAQIRQKDSIIESLLKQLHNPYIATPLSIASYRMATSPSDHNNRNVLAWLDRLQSSVRDAGKQAGPRAFLDLRTIDAEDESDQESESKRTQGQTQAPAQETQVQDNQSVGGEETSQDEEKLQSTLPESHVPLGLIADLSLSNSKAYRKRDHSKEAQINEDDLNDDNVGVANETYFMPGPATDLGIRATLIEQHSAPEILVHGLVKPEDVEKLFQIFYERVNPFISLLDPVLHTPASTFARCPFLFTVICAISSRYYAEKSEIYPIAMHFAKHSAANALIDGWKSVELCQAYILMSIYAVPARRWEEDRSWLYTGLAIRIATDLNLHQVSTIKPHSELQEREILNKTRVWMICFNLDRSTATQFGKPSTIKEDFILRGAKDWYRKSKYNLIYDVHLCGYSALLQIVAKFHDEIFSDPSSPTGLNKKVNFRTVTLAHDEHLTAYDKEWSKRFKDDSDPEDPTCSLRCSLLPFLVAYSRLVMFSFGFQQAYQRGFKDGDSLFFTKCLESAKSVLVNMIEGLAPSGYMRYAPDGHFVFASFASAFLLKLLRPEFSSFLVKEQENEIFDLIGRLIQTLSSPKIAIDDRHTPKLYARFLAGLLSRHRRDGATVGRLQTNPPPSNQLLSSEMQQSSSTMSSALSSRHGEPSSETAYGSDSLGNHIGVETPIYRPEATFAASTGQISFGTDFEMSYGGGNFSDEEMLATMQAIKNPAWWDTMMMPGFSWPEASPSPPVNGSTASSPYATNVHLNGTMPHPPAMPSSFGIFHSAQVMM